jgi:hypothetical protein
MKCPVLVDQDVTMTHFFGLKQLGVVHLLLCRLLHIYGLLHALAYLRSQRVELGLHLEELAAISTQSPLRQQEPSVSKRLLEIQ